MTSRWVILLLAVGILASTAAQGETTASQPAEMISVPVTVQPNELRTYRLTVAIKGCVGIADSEPLLIDAVNTMKLLHRYGRREGDGLLQLDISATDVQAIINGEKAPATDQFPKLTALLDGAWKVNRLFGIENTQYAGQVPGLNYANLLLLFYVPDLDREHALGQAWTSKVRWPGRSDEVTIVSTIKSRDAAARTVTVRQEYTWPEMKLDGDRTVRCAATVDSVFDSSTGKLLKSHAECQLPFNEPSQSKPENRQYRATSRIDISLER